MSLEHQDWIYIYNLNRLGKLNTLHTSFYTDETFLPLQPVYKVKKILNIL